MNLHQVQGHRNYHPTSWTRVHADGSAENAMRNGRGGLFITFPDGSCAAKSVATDQLSTNVRAEACAPAPRSTHCEHQRQPFRAHSLAHRLSIPPTEPSDRRERANPARRQTGTAGRPSAAKRLWSCNGFPPTVASWATRCL